MPARGAMSLYANLLDVNSDNSASISRDSMSFKQDEAADGAPKKVIEPGGPFSSMLWKFLSTHDLTFDP